MNYAQSQLALYVGIDVSSRTNVVCAIDFDTNKHLKFSVPNDRAGATLMVKKFCDFLSVHDFDKVIIALESTSMYGIHIANYLSSSEELMPF
ncbi:MAG: IS110 family transposase, partial [Anaerovoracaceae bacterium]